MDRLQARVADEARVVQRRAVLMLMVAPMPPVGVLARLVL